MAHAVWAVALEERDNIRSVVSIMIGIEVAVVGVARSRTLRDDVQPRDDGQPLAGRVLDHHIAAGPVEAVARARLHVGPREQIDDPARAHLAHLLE